MKFYCSLFSALLALLPAVGAQDDECAIATTTTEGTTEESTGDCPQVPANAKSCTGFVPSDGSGPIDIYTSEDCESECFKFPWTTMRWRVGDSVTEKDGVEYLALTSQCQCYNNTAGNPGVTLCADEDLLHAIPAPLESCTDDGVTSEAECVSKCQELFPWIKFANYPTSGQCSDSNYMACQCIGAGGAVSRFFICSNCTDFAPTLSPTNSPISGTTTIFTTRDGSATMFVVTMMFASSIIFPWLVARP